MTASGLIVVDVGATKTLLAYASQTNGGVEICKLNTYPSSSYAGLSDILSAYLKQYCFEAEGISIGIAGPVFSGRCTATNLPWTVDLQELSLKHRSENLWMCNDLAAQAWGLSCVSSEDKTWIHRPELSTQGNKSLLAAGTGLGQAFLFEQKGELTVCASEGGHCDFGPSESYGLALLKFLLTKHHRVSWERVVSGKMGFYNIYTFLKSTKDFEIGYPFDERSDPAGYGPSVFAAAEQGCPLALKTLELFCYYYGAEAGNMVLKAMTLGGVFLSGGIAKHLRKYLCGEDWFRIGYCNKGRFSDLVTQTPVAIIEDRDLALKGAFQFAQSSPCWRLQ